MNEKERLLLKLLVEREHDFVTSQEIATALFVSDRTVRNYIKRMKEETIEHGGEIVAKQGQGYYLKITNKEKFKLFYQKEVMNNVIPKDSLDVHESKERQYYILNKLFFDQNIYTAEDFSNELFVSYSTITNDLFEIKKQLKKYQLTLHNKMKMGVTVVGDEQYKRNFMMNYFFMNRLLDNFHMFSAYSSLLGELPMNEIIIIVLDECREEQISITDFMISNIVLHIGLAIMRLENGFVIENKMIDIEKSSREYKTALRIIKRLKKDLKVDFPPSEANYIAIHLQNKFATAEILQRTDYTENDIQLQLLTALKEFDKETGFDFSKDQNLLNGLMQHFTPLLARLQNKNYIHNPLLDEIKQKYQQILEYTIHIFSQIPILKDYEINEEEWAYIAIHIIAAVERFFNNQKAKVLVICATGLGSSQVLKMRIENELGSKLVVEKVLGYYEINEEALENIDLIISTIAIPTESYLIPVVHVSVFLGQNDIRKINEELSRIQDLGKVRQKLILETNKTKKESLSLIQKCFHESLFVKFDKKVEKNEVLHALADQISIYENNNIKKELLEQLESREKYGSVAFSEDFAVPHPLQAVTDKALVAIVVAPEGIYWDEDHPNIRLVLLSSPDKTNTVRIERLNQLFVSIIENQEFCENLIMSSTYEQWIDIFIHSI